MASPPARRALPAPGPATLLAALLLLGCRPLRTIDTGSAADTGPATPTPSDTAGDTGQDTGTPGG